MKKVSVIIPILNEERFISSALQSLIDQDYPTDQLEIICIDGMSTDRTREIISNWITHERRISLLENPQKRQSAGLNIGIRASLGEIIVRVDAHSVLPRNYVSELVLHLYKLSADNVGGICSVAAEKRSGKSMAIQTFLTSSMGVGNSQFRIGATSIKEADTVPFGCFKKSIFDQIGYYDERLFRTEDYELNQRLRKSGRKIYLLPHLKIKYFPPTTLMKFCKKQFLNGFGVIETAILYKKWSFLAIRHFVPLIFALYIVCAIFLTTSYPALIIPILMYFFLTFRLATIRALQTKMWVLLWHIPSTFFLAHMAYGLGSLASLLISTVNLLQDSSPDDSTKIL